MFDSPASEAMARIDDWERGFERRAEQARELARRTSGLTSTARSRDGLVEVTVTRDGQVESLHLDEDIRRQPAATTSRVILETLRSAKVDLVRLFDEVTAETVGADSETGQALMSSLRTRLGPLGEDPR